MTGRPELDWDYLRDPGFADDPHAALERLRGRGTFWTSHNRGHWVVTESEGIVEVLQDPATFSSSDVNIPRSVTRRRMVPVEVDAPDHGQYRTMLARFFSPVAARGMEEQLRSYCRTLIARIRPNGGCEFVEEFARPLPAMLFLGLFALPIDDAPTLDGWIEAMALRGRSGLHPRQAADHIRGYVVAAVDQRVEAPGDDLISRLLAAEVGDRQATSAEVVDIVYLLLIAGLDTTSGVLSFCWRHLATHPDDRRHVAGDPSLSATLVEEVLRHYSVATIARVVTTDTSLGGVEMKAGESVLVLPVLAHRVGDETDGVRLDLGPRRHYAFGAGPHRCLGSHLARVELTVAVEEWHREIPEYRLTDPERVTTWGGSIYGVGRLDLAWS